MWQRQHAQTPTGHVDGMIPDSHIRVSILIDNHSLPTTMEKFDRYCKIFVIFFVFTPGISKHAGPLYSHTFPLAIQRHQCQRHHKRYVKSLFA